MTQSFPRPDTTHHRIDPDRLPPLGEASYQPAPAWPSPSEALAEAAAARPEPRAGVPDFSEELPERRPPAFETPDGYLPDDPAEPAGRRAWRSRIRLGIGFAFAVSLVFHSTLLALFVTGTTPGAEDGQEAISVDIITQEQLDVLLGNGSSEGGTPRKVEDTADGKARTRQAKSQPAPQKTESESEQKEALNIIGSQQSPDQLAGGTSERVNDASAPTPRKSDARTKDKGSPAESTPSRTVDPKENPDSDREDARNASKPDPLRPGSDGGEARRLATRGTVGEQSGPLPPTMRQALMHLLQKQIELCYTPPSGATQDVVLPLIQIRFHQDGTLDGLPKSLRYKRTSNEKSVTKAALKAIRQCAPYRMPPRFAPYFDSWKEVRAEFEFSGR